jgi:hypothetical protein
VTDVACLSIHLSEECDKKSIYIYDEVTGLSILKDGMSKCKKDSAI